MAISFIRVDDRVIHGQIITSWSKELKCDGIIGIDDKIAKDPVLVNIFKGAAPHLKVWIFDIETAIEKLPKVIESDKNYFVIAKVPNTLKKLDDAGISLKNSNMDTITVGPMHFRDGARTVGPNACVMADDEVAFNQLEKKYNIEFKLVPTSKSYFWKDVK